MCTPALVIPPRSMLKDEVVGEAISSVSPRAEVTGIYRFNAGLVNRQLKKHDAKAKELAARLQGSVIEQATRNLGRTAAPESSLRLSSLRSTRFPDTQQVAVSLGKGTAEE